MLDLNLNELIGMECRYNLNENPNEWSDDESVKCRIVGFGAHIEEKGLETLSIRIMIEPTEDKITDLDLINSIYSDGVSQEELCFHNIP